MTVPGRVAVGVLAAAGAAAWILASVLLWLIVTRPLQMIAFVTRIAP